MSRAVLRLVATVSLVVILLAPIIDPAVAKGPFLNSSAPITIILSTKNNADIILNQSQASSLGTFVRSIPQFYNSTLKPSISDLGQKANQSTSGQWDRIDVKIAQQPSGEYSLKITFGTQSGYSFFEQVKQSYPVDQTLSQTLKGLNGAGVEITFSVTGPYVPAAVGELFLFTDHIFGNFASLSAQISQWLSGQLVGKSFSWAELSFLDNNAVRVDIGNGTGPILSSYFGTGGSPTLSTITSTSAVTTTVITTASTTLTTTLPPQTTTSTLTVVQVASGGPSKDYSTNAISGLGIGVISAFVLSALVIAIMKRRSPAEKNLT